jgi:tetratricopeptide (TPR) repeat protein
MRYVTIVIVGLLISTGLFGQELERLISAEKALLAGDTTGSIIIFQEVLKEYPDSYAAALRLTEVNYQRALYSEAIQYSYITEDVLLRKLDSLEYHKDNEPLIRKRYYEDLASLYHFKGKIRLKQHRSGSALEELERALRYYGDSSAIYVDIGLAYFEQNHVENAKAAFLTSQRISPNNPSGYFNLGNIYYNNGKYDSAAYYYQRTVEADPDFILAYAYLGEIYTLRGSFEEAVTQYSRYVEREPSEEIYFKRAVIYAELRQWENALEDWDRVIDLNPDNSNALRNRGLSYCLNSA